MPSAVSALYEPLIARDLDAIPGAVRLFRETETADDLFLAVARFAILSFAPSQHARHAVLAALSAYELRVDMGARWEDLLVEVALYAASSRQPWSEPPIGDPPEVDKSKPAGPDELRAAIRDRDRLRAERWLARNLDEPTLAGDLATIACEDLSDLGHNVIVTSAAMRLVPILGDMGKWATLRMAVWQLTAAAEDPAPATWPGRSSDELRGLIERCVAEKGSLESAHAVFLFEAALPGPGGPPRGPATTPPVYRLGRDMGATLKAHAVAKRLRSRFHNAPLDAFIAAVHHNLATGQSLEPWTFA